MRRVRWHVYESEDRRRIGSVSYSEQCRTQLSWLSHRLRQLQPYGLPPLNFRDGAGQPKPDDAVALKPFDRDRPAEALTILGCRAGQSRRDGHLLVMAGSALCTKIVILCTILQTVSGGNVKAWLPANNAEESFVSS